MNTRSIKIIFTIICIYFFNTLSSFAADNNLGLYTFQTLTDQMASMPIADMMIPKGFTASVTSHWDRLDGNYPGHEIISIENSDKSVGIYIFTNESYSQFQNKNTFGINIPQNEGPDYNRYITLMNYKDSATVIDTFMNKLSFSNKNLYKNLPIDNNIINIFRNEYIKAAQENLLKIQKINMLRGNEIKITLKDVNLDKVRKQYKLDNGYGEFSTSIKSVSMTMGNKMMETTAIAWEIQYFILYKASSKELFGKYYDTYRNVLANSYIRPEFYYINMKIRKMYNENLFKTDYHLPPISEIVENEEVMNYYSNSTYNEAALLSDKVMKLWNDCIYELQSYKTLDGRIIKSSMNKEKIAQKGDIFFIGRKNNLPKGFKVLSKVK